MKKDVGKEKNPEFFYPLFFPKTKRGLSEVITILIIIGVSIVAIGMVWVVINNLISGSSDQINTDKSSINLKISSAVTTPSGLDVVVKRNPGKGDISKLAIVVSDGFRRETFEVNQTIEELQQKKFTLSYYGIIESVEIVPFLKSGSGAIIMGNSEDTLTFTPFETVQNIPGLVSWWRLEGDANDETGLNNGVVVGAPKQVNGKYGKAYNLTGGSTGRYIEIPGNPSLELENINFTIVSWIYLNPPITFNGIRHIIGKGNILEIAPAKGYGLFIYYTNPNTFFQFGTDFAKITGVGGFSANKWTHVAGTQNIKTGATTTKFYIDGVINKTGTQGSGIASSSGFNLFIASAEGTGYATKAFIDEVMIFNRTLSDNEISGLYNLDLSG